MGRKRNHIDCKKKNGKHTTVIDGSDKLVELLLARDEVKSISPGIIIYIGSSQSQRKLISVEEIPAGVELIFFGNLFKQIYKVYSAENVDYEDLFKAIDEEFRKTLNKKEILALTYYYQEA